MKTIKTDLCIIGAGSGGLSVAAGAAMMGAKVVLVEQGKMGGDCLNTGCVPSKAMIAAARKANEVRQAKQFGIVAELIQTDYAKVHQHIHDVIATIEPHDSVERFTGMGVKVIQAAGKFINPTAIVAADYQIKARRFVLATGSRPAALPIPGLDQIDYLTNETIFDLTEQPEHLIVIGAGPIGCELAQAQCLLGTKVTVLEKFTALPKDDPQLTSIVKQSMQKDGVALIENCDIETITQEENGVSINYKVADKAKRITGSHILVAAGRQANIANLDLAKANIEFDKRGIKVDARLRTTNKRVFAIGDAIAGLQFTHVANYHAGIVIRNALFHIPAKVDYSAIPWVTYTTPELAHVGCNEIQAKQQKLEYNCVDFPYAENDRAVADRATAGLIKVVLGKKGRILGVSIVGEQAGELILPWVLAIKNKMSIKAMTDIVVAYPTLAEISKRVAGKYYLPTITSKRMHKIVKWLQKF